MRAFVLLAAVALLAGCLSRPSIDDGCDDADCNPLPLPDDAGASVVVADIDSGVNVYHDRFVGEVPADVLARIAATGIEVQTVQTTRAGDFQARFEADKALWDGLETGKLYHFAGTRLLGISFNPASENPILDFPDGSHGTATAGAVFDAFPDAILVMVEGVGAAEGEAWVAQQPWIDLVTMSYGPPGSVPGAGSAMGLTTHTATKQMWAAGKVPVGAADNSPALAPNDETAGPPWVVGVAGDDPQSGCREHASGTFPDFTADFTQTLPDADSVDGRHETSGTSFSTPTTAGTMASALLEVRKNWGHMAGIADGALAVSPDGERLTNAGLREAFNRTAVYFEAGACGEGGLAGTPVNPAAPWLQMGWGHVGPEIVNATVAHLLGVQEAPDKPEARAFQSAAMEYRRQLWAAIP